LGDSDRDAGEGPSAVFFQVELAFEGVVDQPDGALIPANIPIRIWVSPGDFDLDRLRAE
jgi:hypothetical protein